MVSRAMDQWCSQGSIDGRTREGAGEGGDILESHAFVAHF